METNPVKATESKEDLDKKGFLNALTNGLGKLTDPPSKAFGLIGGAIVVLMMLEVFISVFARYLFRRPIPGSLEIAELMMVVIVTLSVIFTTYCKGHIRVDLVLSHVSKRFNLVLDILTEGTAAIIYVFIAWQAYMNILTLIADNKATDILHIPIYLLAILLFISMILIVLVFVKNILDSIRDLRRAS